MKENEEAPIRTERKRKHEDTTPTPEDCDQPDAQPDDTIPSMEKPQEINDKKDVVETAPIKKLVTAEEVAEPPRKMRKIEE